jgi:hypothetical protein
VGAASIGVKTDVLSVVHHGGCQGKNIRPDSAVLRPVQSIYTLSSDFFYLPSGIFIDHIGIFGGSVSDDFFLIADQFYGACPGGSLLWLNSRGIPDFQAHFFEKPPLAEKRHEIPTLVTLIRASDQDMKLCCRVWVKLQPAVFGGMSATAQNKCLQETTLAAGISDSADSTTFDLSASIPSSCDLPPPPFYSEKCEHLFAKNESKAARVVDMVVETQPPHQTSLSAVGARKKPKKALQRKPPRKAKHPGHYK